MTTKRNIDAFLLYGMKWCFFIKKALIAPFKPIFFILYNRKDFTTKKTQVISDILSVILEQKIVYKTIKLNWVRTAHAALNLFTHTFSNL